MPALRTGIGTQAAKSFGIESALALRNPLP
jgi:hypothetical protein